MFSRFLCVLSRYSAARRPRVAITNMARATVHSKHQARLWWLSKKCVRAQVYAPSELPFSPGGARGATQTVSRMRVGERTSYIHELSNLFNVYELNELQNVVEVNSSSDESIIVSRSRFICFDQLHVCGESQG